MSAVRSAAWLSVLVAGTLACEEATPPPATPPPPPPPPIATVAPPPADPPPVVDGDVTVAMVSGMKVIVQRLPGADFAAGQLYIKGGARNWTSKNAGIEQLAFRVAATGGTKSLDKVAYSRRLASLGASITGDAANDFSELAMKVPLPAWDDAFALLAEVFEQPALPPSEVDLARQQSLAQLHHELEDPDGQLWTLERRQIFAGHPYSNRPVGTLDSVAALKAEDLGPYLEGLRETSRLVFVAAGDLDAAHVVDQVRRLFGALRRGVYADPPLPPLVFETPHLVTEERKIPTNYCESAFPAPRWSDPDWATARVAVSGLSHRLWEELRSKRNLTYAVSASINSVFAYPFGLLYVTAVDPNAAQRVMLDEIKRLRDAPIPDAELAGFKSVYLTGYLEGHETPDGHASSLAEADLYGGDWRAARTFPDRVRSVTAPDIQAFAKKYLAHLQTAVVGDPRKLDQALFTSL